MRYIDTHVHFWNYNPDRYSWLSGKEKLQRDFLPEDLFKSSSTAELHSCIAVQADQSEEETQFLLDLAKKHDGIGGVIGWLDLSAGNIEQKIASFSEESFLKGLRHTVWDEKGEFLLDPDFMRGISLLQEHDLIYELLIFDYQMDAAIEFLKHFPEQKFVLNHMAKPDFTSKPNRGYLEKLKKMAAHPKLFCKLTGFLSDQSLQKADRENLEFYLENMIHLFGSERLLYGSDWPMCLHTSSYTAAFEILKNYLGATLNHEQQEKIFFSNAKELYRP